MLQPKQNAKEKKNLEDAKKMKNMRPTGPKTGRVKPTMGTAKNGKTIKTIKKAQNGAKTKDSTDYFKGKAVEAVFERGRTRDKNIINKSSASKKVQDDKRAVDKINNLNESLNRQSKKGKPGYDANGFPKKKAKNGTSLGMKSVKAGVDKNPGVTRADIITAATKKAKSGDSMKKCKYGCK